MARNLPKPEDIFLNDIKKLIRNLLIDNSNYVTDYYHKKDGFGCHVNNLLTDTKERAKYILTRISETEHLIKDIEPK